MSSDVGDDADDGSEKTPFRTIAHALTAITPGEPIVLRLKGTLRQAPVTVPSGVTLQGPATIIATTAGPAVRITDVGPARTTDVELRDLVVSGLGPYTGDGGAVLVENADRVTLERCELRDSVAGRGGGLAVLGSTAVEVRACTIHDNTAGTPAKTLESADIAPSLKIPTRKRARRRDLRPRQRRDHHRLRRLRERGHPGSAAASPSATTTGSPPSSRCWTARSPATRCRTRRSAR